jgi:tetratricopeptide (TPR) repeat protein
MGQINLGNVSSALGHSDIARSHHLKALALAKTIGNREGEVVAIRCVANSLSDAGEYAVAELLYRQAMKIADCIGASIHQGACLLSVGIALERQGKSAEAIPYFQKALKVGLFGERNHEANCYACLGISYAKCGDLAHAIEAHETALKLSLIVNDPVLRKSCRHNLILDYEAAGDWARAKALEREE